MSKLEELIQQYCPDGVEWKTLGEATIMKRGTSVTKGIMQEGNIPVISGGRQPAFYCNVSNRTGEVITVAGSGAGAGYVQYWNEPIFVCDAFSIQGNETLKTKYVYYILTNIKEKRVMGKPCVSIQKLILVVLRKRSPISLWQPMCHRTRISIPPCQGGAKKVSLWQAILHRVRSTLSALPK
ncbi:MAG: hypothetical protein UD286_04485 [Bacteroidales bacterium]|nr:hypothetical protein [Bacteroidales bacterium]